MVPDPITEQAAQLFLARVRERFVLRSAYLFGSRARQTATSQSDADIALLLEGIPGSRADTAIEMAAMAFDVMLETGVLVDALPLWETEWRHPELAANPELIRNIRHDGVPL